MKVLDFCLAKALEPVEVGRGDVTASPTITSPALTQIGMILGTAAYLSPEQVKGRPADKRSDVWAFGAVLYEMLSGQHAFKGEDISDTLAAVLRQTIDVTGLPRRRRRRSGVSWRGVSIGTSSGACATSAKRASPSKIPPRRYSETRRSPPLHQSGQFDRTV